ncbi:MAG: tetratricopeptide repeat protein, partial [Rickettsiaceae bacterium]|nr:tetratricopeptide repeat protein [Rickettsiaceae bacterium]
GMKFDVKNEIYRLADRFIYSLSLICGVVTPSMNLWSSIESMVDKKFINQKAGENLTAALSFANILRLKFYDHCGQQAKHLDIITESRKKGVFADGELSEDGIFFRFYYVLIPLIRSLEDFTYAFIAGNDVKEFFKENDFYDDNEWIKGTIYGRLLNYQSAQRCFEGSLKDLPECFDSANKLCYVANIYQQLGEYLEAINLYQKAVAIYEKTHTKVADIEIAKCREKMGMVYLACEDFEKAYDEYSKSLEIYENYNEQERIASSYDDFSSLCRTTSKKYPALSISQKAADIRKTLQEKTENHLSSAVSLMNLGMAYHDVGYYEKAFRKVTRALNTLESEYSIQHPDVGICIKNLGTILRSMGKYEEALERHNQAFNILKKETDIAACMNDIGLDLLALSKNYYALQMFEQVREAYTTIYGSSHHLVASCINNIGKVFDNADMYYWAICNYYSAFLMMKESYGSEDRSSFNDCLSHVAEIYYKFGMKREAVTILENVVESLNKKFKYSSHPNIATLLERIGNIYEKLGDEKEAWIKYDQAVEICEYFMENDKSHSKHHLKDFYSRILPCCKTSNLDMEVEVTGEKIIELDSNF